MSIRPPLDLEALHLSIGLHAEDSGEMCVMEAVAYVAGEDWTDHPASVSPVIREFVQGLNDAMDDVDRQALRTLVPVLAGSRGDDAQEAARSWSVMDWHCRTWPSAWLRSAGCVAEAGALESTPAIVDNDTLRAALEPLRIARATASAKRIGFINALVEEGLASAIDALGGDESDSILATAEAAIRAATGWPEMRLAQKAPTLNEGWDVGRRNRWNQVWDAGGYRAAVALQTAQIAGVRALAATSAWRAAWSASRAESDDSWDLACVDARISGRDAALAVAMDATWTLTGGADQPLSWLAAEETAAAALESVTRDLQRGAIRLIATMAHADLEKFDLMQPHAR